MVAGQVALVEVATGVTVHRWPVDARDLVANGDFVTADAWASTAAVEPAEAVEPAKKGRR